jgi:hypothetical protein
MPTPVGLRNLITTPLSTFAFKLLFACDFDPYISHSFRNCVLEYQVFTRHYPFTSSFQGISVRSARLPVTRARVNPDLVIYRLVDY